VLTESTSRNQFLLSLALSTKAEQENSKSTQVKFKLLTYWLCFSEWRGRMIYN